MKFRSSLTILIALLLSIGFAGAVWASGNPLLKLESKSEMEIDLKMMVADLVPPLLEAQQYENEEEAIWVEMVLDLLGVQALDRLALDSSISGGKGHSRMEITLDPAVEGRLLGALFSVPEGEFRFGRYLKQEDTAGLLSVCNFRGRLEAMLDFLTDPALREMIPDVGEDEDGELVLFGINPRRDILPLLDGELDLLVFSGVSGGLFDMPPLALVFGASDGFALRDKILEIAGSIIGPEAVAEMSSIEGEEVGSFELYSLPGGISYAVDQEYLVITNAQEELAPLLAEPGGDFAKLRAAQYVRVDGDLLVEMIGGFTEMAAAGGSEEDQIGLAILTALGDEPIGLVEAVTRTKPGRLEIEVDFPASLVTLQYQMLRHTLAMAPQLAAAGKQEDQYWAIVSEVDPAMTLWGLEHAGTFPEALDELVSEDYLEALPDLEMTPLGVYREGGYTYLPLRDEQGAVVGYYFFVYGGGEDTGYDVFTAENLADQENFSVDRDGKPDGVASFAYDGVAVDQIENWQMGW